MSVTVQKSAFSSDVLPALESSQRGRYHESFWPLHISAYCVTVSQKALCGGSIMGLGRLNEYAQILRKLNPHIYSS